VIEVAELQVYYFGIILILGAAPTFYYLYSSSDKYFTRSKVATRAAIHRLDKSAESTEAFFEGYETIHEEYDKISANAHAYIRFGMGLLAAGAVVIGFNILWDGLIVAFGNLVWVFVLLVAALVWSAYLNLQTIRGIQATLQLKPIRYVFRNKKQHRNLRQIIIALFQTRHQKKRR